MHTIVLLDFNFRNVQKCRSSKISSGPLMVHNFQYFGTGSRAHTESLKHFQDFSRTFLGHYYDFSRTSYKWEFDSFLEFCAKFHNFNGSFG